MINEVEIGGQLVPRQSFEAIANISSNKTMLIQKLTSKPAKAVPVKGLKTIDDVFNFFRPSVDVELEDEKGALKKEEMKFNSLLDFKKEGIVAQSDFLSKLQAEQDACNGVIRKLKTNKILKTALQNPEAKKNILQLLKQLVEEIDQANS